MPSSKKQSEDEAKVAKLVRKKTPRNQEKKVEQLSRLAKQKHSVRTVHPSLFLFTLHFIYKNLYILGITIMRRRLRYARRLRLANSKARGMLYALGDRIGASIKNVYTYFAKRIRAPFIHISNIKKEQQPYIDLAKKTEGNRFDAYLPVVEAVGRMVLKILITLFNYSAPVVAGWFLFTTVNSHLNEPIGLMLKYNNQEMGYIQNEASFDQATRIVRERITDASAQQFVSDVPLFELKTLENQNVQMIDEVELADMIFRTSGFEIQDAYGLYVGSRFLGAVTDKDAVLTALNEIKAGGRAGKPGERTEFVRRIELTKKSPFPQGSLVDTAQVIDMLRSNEEEEESYEVQPGDTPSGIADKQGIAYQRLKELNPGIEEDLKPGMQLRVRVARPFLSVKSIYTDTYEEEVAYDTVEVENAMYAKGYRNVFQEGMNGLDQVTAEISIVNGIETGREILERKRVRNPVAERVTVGVNNPSGGGAQAGTAQYTTDMTPAASKAGFIWPTVSGRATTYRNHSGNGVDIAPGGGGHPIYAAASGTVAEVKAGWTGYGHYIIIDHGNGYHTLYAHNSALYVSKGDYVEQGQVIAAMGRTGWATGNHLHFEVRYNGRYMNPTDYIGYYG